MKSWKTTVAGLAPFLAVLGTALNAQFDGKPETVPQWEVVIVSLGGLLVGLFARDNDKSSEDVGVSDQKRAGGHIGVPLLFLAVLLAGVSGCATAHQGATSKTTTTTTSVTVATQKVGTNTVSIPTTNVVVVVEERSVNSAVTAAGDAKQSIAAMSARNSKATQAIGTQGLQEESSLQGVVEILGLIFEAGKSAGKSAATGGIAK